MKLDVHVPSGVDKFRVITMKIEMDTKFFYLHALIVFLFCVLCSLYFSHLFDGIWVGLLSLIFLITLDKVKTQEVKEFTEKQLKYRRIGISFSMWNFALFILPVYIRQEWLYKIFFPVIIFNIIFLYICQRLIIRKMEKNNE